MRISDWSSDVCSSDLWTVSARQRPALLLVGHHLLDRVLRAGKLRVPCPERDLVLDTGLTDRKTIRAALRLFDGRLGTLRSEERRVGKECVSPCRFRGWPYH